MTVTLKPKNRMTVTSGGPRSIRLSCGRFRLAGTVESLCGQNYTRNEKFLLLIMEDKFQERMFRYCEKRK